MAAPARRCAELHGGRRMKFSLSAQIDEIDRELEQRRTVYPRLIATRQLRQSIADYQVERLRAVRETLVWLSNNELTIKQRLAQ